MPSKSASNFEILCTFCWNEHISKTYVSYRVCVYKYSATNPQMFQPGQIGRKKDAK